MAFFNIFSGIKFLTWIAVLFIIWQFFLFLSPAPRPLNALEVSVVNKFSNGLVDELMLNENVQKLDRPIEVGILHLVNDKSGEITALLTASFEKNTNFVVSTESVPYKFVKELGKNLAKSTSVEEIVGAGQNVNIDLLVGGKVESCIGNDDVANLDLNIYVFSPKLGKMIKYEKVVETFDVEKDNLDSTLSSNKKRGFWKSFWMMIIAIVVVLVLPWLTEPLIWKVADKKSNGFSFMLLLGYIAIDIVVIIAMGGILFVSGSWLAVVLAVYIFLLGGYNYLVVEKIAKNY